MRTLSLLGLIACSAAAQANGPAPAPVPAAPSSTGAAQAQAQAVASAQAQAGGGAGGSGSASLVGDRSLSLFLPPPSFTPPMAALAGCAPVITQSAWSAHLLIAGGSHAESRTDPTDCTLIALHNAAVSQCRYATARQIADLLTSKLLPKFVAGRAELTDYTPRECAALTEPKPAKTVEYLPVFFDAPAKPVAPPRVACDVPQKARVVPANGKKAQKPARLDPLCKAT